MYKIALLNLDGKIAKYYVFHGSSNNEKNQVFSSEELKMIQDNNTEISYISQNIRIDDSIETIKKKIIIASDFNYSFDDEIIDKMLDRALKDKFFRKRQGLAAILAILGKKIYLDKIIFGFFRIPFPYFKLIITK